MREGAVAVDGLRVGDLARAAGVSAQRIRGYAADGLLPPAGRSAGGQRVFTGAHLAALTALRELAAGHGWPTARAVMRAVHAGDLPAALAALDAGHAALDRERTELAALHTALTEVLAAGPPAPGPGREALRIGEAARVAGVRPPVLRLWEARGLLRPEREPGTGYRRYGRAELHAARVIALLRRGHRPLATIEAVLAGLRESGSPERVLAELARREQEVTGRSVRCLAASAALHAYLGRPPAGGVQGR
ncbi:MerR family transcriptional regulator [Streptomyces sp. ODS05-4]|uniref:MerR family transcriptional regulator n=1 Tax=Streptomyces sp. ODS05-4 TaxID=2944939 RepID=UPI00210AB099|nr:MerR family transcriptional regulator [Streptomyces sp. ODS05-4]